MGEEIEIGIEVAPGNGPEIVPQPDANKYFIKAQWPKNFASDTFLQSSPPDTRSREVRKLFFLLALFAILSLAIAVGAGLAIGLAARHKYAPSSGPTAVVPIDSSAAIKTTTPAKVITLIATPPPENIPSTTPVPSTLSNTQSEEAIAPASRPPISATISSPVCPADDRLIYNATNKPTPTAGPELEITNATLEYQIFCYTNYVANPPIRDLQTLYDMNSLQECLEACALYSFQTKPVDFPAFACTGIAWARGATQICWLKSNVTSSSANGTDEYPGIDGAVMVQ